jgi:hypothetical protein
MVTPKIVRNSLEKELAIWGVSIINKPNTTKRAATTYPNMDMKSGIESLLNITQVLNSRR